MKYTKQQKVREFLKSIYVKAWNDNTFKQDLVNNPIETLNKFIGKEGKLPKDKRILVEDQTNPNHIYLNIPVKPNLEDTELTEERLNTISGGFFDFDDSMKIIIDEMRDCFIDLIN